MRNRDHRAVFRGAALLSAFAVVGVAGCGGNESRSPGGASSGGAGGETSHESGGAAHTGGLGSVASGGASPGSGGAIVTGGAGAGTGGLSATGGATQITGGASTGSGGDATGGSLASGGTGGASAGTGGASSGTGGAPPECKYPIPETEGEPECTSSACKADEGYEIRISTPGGFYVGHLIWVLNACNAQFYRSTALGGNLETLQFLLSESEFESLPQSLPLSAFYGSPGNTTGARHMNCGTVNLSDPPACSSE